MLIQPIDYFLLVWFVLAGASTLYVGLDQYRNNPEPVVMKWGFILVTLYMGPLGLLLYVLADKEPRPGEHETFIRPLWKQGVGSTIHCVAGDATGIILAAVVVALRLAKTACILSITLGATDSFNSCSMGSAGVSHCGLPTCAALRGLEMFALTYTLRLTMSAISASLISMSRAMCTKPSMPAATKSTASA